MTVLLPLSESAGPGSPRVTPQGLGTSRTGHASREAVGTLPAGASASCSEPPRLPSQTAPASQQSPQGAESWRSRLAGSGWHLCLALAAGTGAEEKGTGGQAGRAQPPQAGQHPATAAGAGGHHPTGSCTLQEGPPTCQGLQGSGGRWRRGARLAPCLLHPWVRSPQGRGAGKWGTLRGNRDPRKGGALG